MVRGRGQEDNRNVEKMKVAGRCFGVRLSISEEDIRRQRQSGTESRLMKKVVIFDNIIFFLFFLLGIIFNEFS